MHHQEPVLLVVECRDCVLKLSAAASWCHVRPLLHHHYYFGAIIINNRYSQQYLKHIFIFTIIATLFRTSRAMGHAIFLPSPLFSLHVSQPRTKTQTTTDIKPTCRIIFLWQSIKRQIARLTSFALLSSPSGSSCICNSFSCSAIWSHQQSLVRTLQAHYDHYCPVY